MLKNKFNIGIAGVGVVGKKRKHFIEKNPIFSLKALCDIKFIGSESISEDISYFSDPFKMINEVNLDAIFVCLTNDIAPQVVIDALNKGIHVFCEKPPGKNLKDIQNVIQAEKSSKNTKLMYGFNHRFHDSVRKAKSIIDSEKLGKIVNMNGVYGKSKIITFNQDDWRTKRDIAGGGVLLDQGIHMVDLMRFFAGEFNDIHSFVKNSFWKHDVEDNAYALMQTSDGIVCMLHSSATSWRHRFSLSITLEKGALILSGILSGSKSYGDEKLIVITSDYINDEGNPEEITYKFNNDPSWKDEVNEFAHCISNDVNVTHGSSDDAYKTMETVYKIYYADKDWQTRYNIQI